MPLVATDCFDQVEPLKEANAWLEQYRKLWEERLDRLEVYLKEMQE